MLTTYNTCAALQYTTCQSRGGQAGGTAVCSPPTAHVQHYNIQHVRVEGVRQEGRTAVCSPPTPHVYNYVQHYRSGDSL